MKSFNKISLIFAIIFVAGLSIFSAQKSLAVKNSQIDSLAAAVKCKICTACYNQSDCEDLDQCYWDVTVCKRTPVATPKPTTTSTPTPTPTLNPDILGSIGCPGANEKYSNDYSNAEIRTACFGTGRAYHDVDLYAPNSSPYYIALNEEHTCFASTENIEFNDMDCNQAPISFKENNNSIGAQLLTKFFSKIKNLVVNEAEARLAGQCYMPIVVCTSFYPWQIYHAEVFTTYNSDPENCWMEMQLRNRDNVQQRADGSTGKLTCGSPSNVQGVGGLTAEGDDVPAAKFWNHVSLDGSMFDAVEWQGYVKFWAQRVKFKNFDIQPRNINLGQSVTISWDVINATKVYLFVGDAYCDPKTFITTSTAPVDSKCIANHADAREVAKSGSMYLYPASTTNFYLYAFGPSGEGFKYIFTNPIKVIVTAPSTPTCTLSADPTSITSGSSSTLTWSSTNATSCSASWTSSTATSGTKSVSPSSTTTYDMTCTGAGGSGSCSTTVTVGTPTHKACNPNNQCVSVTGAGADTCTTDASCTPNVLPAGYHENFQGSQSIDYCRAAGWAVDPDNRSADLNIRILSDGTQVATTIANILRPDLTGQCPSGTCAYDINIYNFITKNVSHSIRVQAQDAQTEAWIDLTGTPLALTCVSSTITPTLSVGLITIPSSGTAPLKDVDLTADVSGTATGTINYKFDCRNDGTWDYTFDNISDNPKTVIDACNYPSPGTYTAKVMVERGTADSATALATITVENPAHGTIQVGATLDGDAWSGNVNYTLSGPDPAIVGTTTPLIIPSVSIGSYTISVTSGGPTNATLDNISPVRSLLVLANQTTTFTLNFKTITGDTLSTTLVANPSSGKAPLNNVVLTADPSGTASGTINYTFYCNRSDSGKDITDDYAYKKDGTNSDPYSAPAGICDSVYANPGTYTAKVIVERDSMAAEARATVTVSPATHRACVDDKCVPVAGSGLDLCINDPSCKPTPPPFACNFSWSPPESPKAKTAVDFFDYTQTPEGTTLTSWDWTFESGTPATSSEQSPGGVIFNSAGEKTVTLSATNSDNNTCTLSQQVTVQSLNPKWIEVIPK